MSSVEDLLSQFAIAKVGDTPKVSPNSGAFDAAYRAAAARSNGYDTTDIDAVLEGSSNAAANSIGINRYHNDRYVSGGTVEFDDVAGAVLGTAAEGLGGIAATGLGFFSDEAGTWMAEQFGDARDERLAAQSGTMKARRRANEVLTDVYSEQHKKQFEADRKTDGDLVATLKRVGRDALSGASHLLEDPYMLNDGIASGVGSVLAGGALGKGLQVAGRAAAPLGVAALEGGGAYQQTVDEIMAMDHDALMEGSADYARLISQNVHPDKARREIANDAGLRAAAITAPVAGATWFAGGKLENLNKAVLSGRGALVNAGKEAVEEGIQSGASQLATNEGIRAYADKDRDMAEGVGTGIGVGAVLGIGTSAAVQSPGLAATGTIALGKAAAGGAKAVGGKVLSRAEAIEAEVQAASPVSDKNVSDMVDTVVSEAPASQEILREAVEEIEAEPEIKQEAQAYIDRLVGAVQFNEAELEGLPESVAETLSGSVHRFDAIKRLIKATLTEEDPQRKFHAAFTLYATLAGTQDITSGANDAVLAQLPADHDAHAIVRGFQSSLNGILSNPGVRKALDAIDSMAQEAGNSGLLALAEDITSPEAQTAIDNNLAVAEHSPLNADPDAVNRILAHDAKGDLRLTDGQRANLMVARQLLDTHKQYLADLESTGKSSNKDYVSDDILTSEVGGEASKRKPNSANSHIKRIMEAFRAGNDQEAKDRLEHFGRFAQHMQNKVAALNEHAARGGGGISTGVRYQSLHPTGTGFRDSLKPLYVVLGNTNSENLARAIGYDAKAIGTLFNGMTEILSTLGVKPLDLATLELDAQTTTEVSLRETEAVAKPEPTPEPKVKDETPVEKSPKAEEKTAAPVAVEPEKAPVEEAPVEPVTPERLPAFQRLLAMASTKSNNKNIFDYMQDTPAADRLPLYAEEIGFPVEFASADVKKAVQAHIKPILKQMGITREDLLGDILVGSRNDSFHAMATKASRAIVMSPHVAATLTNTDTSLRIVREVPHILTHELGHVLDFQGSQKNARGSDNSKFGLKGKLYPEFLKLKPVMEGMAAHPTWNYIEKHMQDGNTAEFFAEAFRMLYTYPDLVTEHAPNVRAAIEEILDTAEGSKRAVSVPDTRGVGGDVSSGTTEAGSQAEARVVDPAVPEVLPTSVEEAFPGLVKTERVTSKLGTAFKVPAKPRSRIFGSQSPLALIKQALTSDETLLDFVGSSVKRTLSPEMAKDYADQLAMAERLKTQLQKNLQKFLSRPATKDKSRGTIQEDWLSKGLTHHYTRGRILNLLEQQGDKFDYNQQLLEGAVLAAVQWLLTADNNKSRMDDKAVKNLLGLKDRLEVTNGMINVLSDGITLVAAKESLGRKIQDYWGLRSNDDAGIGLVDGIPQAMASDIIDAFVEMKVLEAKQLDLKQLFGLENHKSMWMFKPAVLSEDSSLAGFIDALDMAIMVEPEPHHFVGEAPKKVGEHQLRNSDAPLTKSQKDTLAFEQSIPHFPRKERVSLYTSLGLPGILRLHGGGITEGALLNKVDKEKRESQNLSFTSAFKSFLGLMAQVENYAETNKLELWQTPIFFAYEFIKSNRMQMMGQNNPQASKLMREVIMPTVAKLNLRKQNEKHFSGFMLGIAQAIGSRVHEQSREKSIQAVLDAANPDLVGKVKTSVVGTLEILQSWLQDEKPFTDAQIDVFVNELGQGSSPVALSALLDYARYLNASEKDRGSFETSVYVEADGVANGPANAMNIFSHGWFSTKWLKNARKGGMFIGRNTETMNRYRDEDNVDLYGAGSVAFSRIIGEFRDKYAYNEDFVKASVHLSGFMDILLDDVTVGDNSEMSFSRGIIKNPMTITLYGSRTKGIAGNIAGEMASAIYKRISAAMQKQAANPELSFNEAFFPEAVDAEHADQLGAKYQAALKYLTSRIMVRNRRDDTFFEMAGSPISNFAENPANFELSRNHLANLQHNLNELFVKPMSDAVSETVTSGTTDTMDVIQRVTQVQSIVMSDLWDQAVKKKLAEKKEEGGWYADDFLSRNELKAIESSLVGMGAFIETGEQNYYVASSAKTDLVGKNASEAMSGSFGTVPSVSGPTDVGVSGISILVQGNGDGLAMQLMSTTKNAIKGTLKIFDGVHLPIDQLDQGALHANQAVYGTWQRNPMAHLARSYAGMLGNLKLEDLSQEGRLALKRAFFGMRETGTITDAELTAELLGLGHSVAETAQSIAARQKAISRVNVSVDQMASVGVPYSKTGEIDLTGLQDEHIQSRLNELYKEELEKAPLVEMPLLGTAPTIKKAPTFLYEGYGRVLPSGVRKLSQTAIRALVKTLDIPAEQKAVLGDILRSGATKEYAVVYGDRAQLVDYAHSKGLDLPTVKLGTEEFGYTDPDNATIYLLTDSAETLVHELLHAATFDKIDAYYLGQDMGAETDTQRQAVKNIEALMNQFLMFDPTGMVGHMQRDFLNAADAIGGHLGKGNKAAALNEYMAWGLSNQNLASLQAAEAATPLAQIAKKTLAFVKRLIFGRRHAAKPAEDMLSNLRFNTAILMQEKLTASKALSGTILHQSRAYGQNERLTRLNQVMEAKVISHLREEAHMLNEGPDKETHLLERRMEIFTSSDVVNDVLQAGFRMNEQEKTTFELMVTVLSSAVALDPNALSKAQEMYTHVTKVLTPDHFIPDDAPQEYAYHADSKYDVVMGNIGATMDSAGRSSLLPVFLSLAMVNEEFRGILAGIELPEKTRDKSKTFDAYLTNVATMGMDALSDKLSGVTKNDKDVAAVIDGLTQRVLVVAEDRKNFIETHVSSLGTAIDKANAWTTRALDALGKAASEKGEKLRDSTDKKALKTVGELTSFVGKALDTRTAKRAADDAMKAIDSMDMAQTPFDLINDAFGRTLSNAGVYDLIKQVRDWVDRHRQQYRERLPGIIAERFDGPVSDGDWAEMTKGMVKTGLASLVPALGKAGVLDLLKDSSTLGDTITTREATLKTMFPKDWKAIQAKGRQLAHYMNTHEAGVELLRNAAAVTSLLNQGSKTLTPTDSEIAFVDALISLYAFEGLSDVTKNTLSVLANNQAEGMRFSLDYLVGQHKDEMAKVAANPALKFNHFKGYIAQEPKQNGSLVIAQDDMAAQLELKGYARVADYEGPSGHYKSIKKGYYLSPVSGNASYMQGVMQNVRETGFGTDAITGYSLDLTGGQITDPTYVLKLSRRKHLVSPTNEQLMPVYDADKQLIAYELSANPKHLALIQREEGFHKLMGAWRGRQFEEDQASKVNSILIGRIHGMYDKATAEERKSGMFINVLDVREQLKDPVLADAVKLINPRDVALAESLFGDGEFWIRKSMWQDSLGYRSASVSDMWNDSSRWDDEHRKATRKVLLGLLGKNAYTKLVTSEKFLQNVITDARHIIVVKSIVVPAANIVSNIYQLVARGVPIASIARGMVGKTAEVNTYLKGRLKLDELEAELRAADGDPRAERRLEIQIQTIKDSHKSLSIWPLIEAGEFSAISDGNFTREDLAFGEGRLGDYVEKLVDKLPAGAKAFGRYAYMSRDTALFQGLQKTVEYGDFLAKAVLYEDLTKRQRKPKDEALASITEEFVNYDRLPGRGRGYLESVGLLWFWNFKIRSMKVALSILRNNPVHAFMAMAAPQMNAFGDAGLPVTDNLAAVALDGRLDNSLGFGMGLRAGGLHPVSALLL